MADFTDRIQLIVDAVTGNAQRNLKSLSGQLQQSEQPVGRVRGAFDSLGSTIRNNLGLSLVGAGTALVGFGTTAVRQFQETALEAGKLADATGLAITDASRWREVVGDLGLNSDLIAGAINRINRAAAQGTLAQYGIQADDANERLILTLQYLQGITDETARSEAATKLFGRSWTELAPLVEKAGELRDRLGEVSDAKVIDEEERKKAEKLRDALDDLKDVGEDLALTLGESLTPALSTLADTVRTLNDLGVPRILEWWSTAAGFASKLPPPLGFNFNPFKSPFDSGNDEPDVVVKGPASPAGSTFAPFAAAGAALSTVTVNNYLPPGVDPNTVIDAWNRYGRNDGTDRGGSVR